MALQAEPASVDHDFAALGLGRINPLFNPRLVLRRHDRTIMGVRIVRHTNPQRMDCGYQLFS